MSQSITASVSQIATRIAINIEASTILIIDDIPANLAVAVDYLEVNKFRVVVAQDGEEGIERAKLVQPDLILLDVMMPRIDGFETCRRLKMDGSTWDIPVIFMTALADTGNKIAAFAAGAVDYVSKPFQIEELLARIKTHLTLRAAQTQLVEQNAQLEVSGARYRRLFETAKDGILLLDSATGEVTDVNASAVHMLGYGRDHFLHHKLCDVLPFTATPDCREGLATLQTAESVAFECWELETKDKELVDVEFIGNVYQVDGARIVQCNLRDITSRKRAEARIRYMALHDALTGLPNRILLQDRLTQAIALACRNQERVAVLMIDLDQFKHINDSLGHHVGDGLLEAVSARIKSCLRESDIVARLGGDEFVVVLPAIADSRDIEEVVQKLLAGLLEPFLVEGHHLKISGSIGAGQYPTDGDNPEALLRAADAAMYAAKAKGRGTYCLFSPELDLAIQRRILLVSDLHTACERGQLTLNYQPQIATGTGVITAVEALLRWNHPSHGSVSPAEFIPLLEEMGGIVPVGMWVLRTACLQNAAWQKAGLPPVRMAVNVSAKQFYHGDLVKVVEEALRESGLAPKWLDLELTESLTLDGSATTVHVMNSLKALGVGLTLDDFGTGWSSLSCLRHFPLDRIKIDRSFMHDIMSEPAAEAVVTSIIDLARNLGFVCIAEGVETAAQLEYLERKHCPEIQGYIYSPALSALACGNLLLTGKPNFVLSGASANGGGLWRK
jgi:diguanylate cyclase (GGDEF)-like protein/PAS domain S-box-containing protein